MDDILIKTENLSYQVGSRFLLKDIHWKIKKGEKWLLFGLNGCGKTTLLSVVAGLRGGFSGTVKVFGEHYSKENIMELRKKIAFVSSSFYDKIFSNESLLNIVLSGKSGTLSCENAVSIEDKNKAKRLLARFHLSGREDHAYNWLSKGERQSVLLARAMMSEAELLILDEPCSGLDITARSQLLDYIEQLTTQDELTVIYVTHYADEILQGFTHAILMEQGKIMAQGMRDEVIRSENFSKFIKQPLCVYWKNGRLQLEYQKEG